MRRLVVLCLVFWLISVSARSDDVAPLRIRNVHIQSLGVFDPKHQEFQSWVFRALNRMHVTTRPSFVRKELLFREGDLLVRDLLRESERNLRRYSFLTEVSVRAKKINGSEADVFVRTEDQWTTRVQLSLGRSRGYRNLDLGIDEENFLGLGKRVAIKYQRDVERNGITTAFTDPRFFDTRLRFQLRTAYNSDGYQNFITLTQPFFSQETEWSYGAHFDNLKKRDHLYFQGVDAATLLLRQNSGEIFVKRSWGDRRRRLRLGPLLAYEERIFPGAPHILDEDAASSQHIRRNLTPVEKRIASFGFNVEAEDNDFHKFYYLDNFGRTEDLPQGMLGGITVLQAMNAKGDNYLGAGLYTRWSVRRNESQFFVSNLEFSIRRQSAVWNNVFFQFSSRYYLQAGAPRVPLLRAKRQTIAVRFASTLTRDIDAPFQLTLGEQDGLRGYPFRAFNGSNRLLLNIEDRIFTRWENRIFALAVVPFFDAGYIWGKKSEPEFGASAGLGLRIGFKKYGNTKVFRLDFGYPLANARSRGFSVAVSSGQFFRVF